MAAVGMGLRAPDNVDVCSWQRRYKLPISYCMALSMSLCRGWSHQGKLSDEYSDKTYCRPKDRGGGDISKGSSFLSAVGFYLTQKLHVN